MAMQSLQSKLTTAVEQAAPQEADYIKVRYQLQSVLFAIAAAAETLNQLGALFAAIRTTPVHTDELAQLGIYTAQSWANDVDLMREEAQGVYDAAPAEKPHWRA